MVVPALPDAAGDAAAQQGEAGAAAGAASDAEAAPSKPAPLTPESPEAWVIWLNSHRCEQGLLGEATLYPAVCLLQLDLMYRPHNLSLKCCAQMPMLIRVPTQACSGCHCSNYKLASHGACMHTCT